MPILQGGRVIAGSGLGEPLLNAGAPVNGTNAVQTITVDATSGTFKLQYGPLVTAAIAFGANSATVQTALEAVMGSGNVVTSGALSTGMTATAAGDLAKRPIEVLTVANNSLAGNTHAVTIDNTTPGVEPTGNFPAAGALLIDTTNKIVYINTGTAAAPTFTKVGTQT